MDYQYLLDKNIEIEGALRTLMARPTPEAHALLKRLVTEFYEACEPEFGISVQHLTAIPAPAACAVESEDAIEAPEDDVISEETNGVSEDNNDVISEEACGVSEEAGDASEEAGEDIESRDTSVTDPMDGADGPAHYVNADGGLLPASHRLALTINDQYRYARAMFGGSREALSEAVAKIESMSSLPEAYDYMLNDLDLDVEDDEVKDFISMVAALFNS